jgi:hypothetical protein
MHCRRRSRACWCGSEARSWTCSRSLSILEARKVACDCGEPTQLDEDVTAVLLDV